MTYDVFTFNGEYDLLEIRLNFLDAHVDQFIIVEAPTTFSGSKKPFYYEREKYRYKKWERKIRYFTINENYSAEEIAAAEASHITRGATHWKHEFLQKESIKKALTHIKDSDTCYIGDVDEIWDPGERRTGPIKLRLRVYSYYLNNRSSEEFWGTLVARYGDIKNKCFNHLRADPSLYDHGPYGGWHFTSMGGVEEMRRKLRDSYTSETYNNFLVRAMLKFNILYSKDFLRRGFKYRIDESEWPQYLREHRNEYLRLLRQ